MYGSNILYFTRIQTADRNIQQGLHQQDIQLDWVSNECRTHQRWLGCRDQLAQITAFFFFFKKKGIFAGTGALC